MVHAPSSHEDAEGEIYRGRPGVERLPVVLCLLSTNTARELAIYERGRIKSGALNKLC